MLSQGAAGELDQLCRARSDLLDRFGPTTNPMEANGAAWSAALAPGLDAHAEALVRMAELAVNGDSIDFWKTDYLNTLGAALYRAARFEDAIRRLEEGIQLRNGISLPQNWVFLALAHHRLGHRDDARRYLEQLRSRQPSTHPNQFWDELDIHHLQSAAEAVIVYDPIFPADPFAH
jgi:tetratricopeptide (TPR) repeat protein